MTFVDTRIQHIERYFITYSPLSLLFSTIQYSRSSRKRRITESFQIYPISSTESQTEKINRNRFKNVELDRLDRLVTYHKKERTRKNLSTRFPKHSHGLLLDFRGQTENKLQQILKTNCNRNTCVQKSVLIQPRMSPPKFVIQKLPH